MMCRRPNPDRRDERGAVLIIAMAFLLSVGLVAIATADMAANAGANTVNTRAQVTAQVNIESTVSAAVSATRTTYDYAGCSSGCYASPPSFTSSASDCTPTQAANSLQVWCEGSGGYENGSAIRTVDFYVCATGACSATSTSSAYMFVEAGYRDVPEGEAQSNDLCTATATTTCGITMTINAWDVRAADS